MTDDYETVLDIVAENPGINRSDLIELVADHDIEEPTELLDQALEVEDVLYFNGRHWIVRKGRFSFSEYDHPGT
jgi:hypothetical protein